MPIPAHEPAHPNDPPTEPASTDRLKAELIQAFAAPDSSYHPLTAADVIARNGG